MGLFGKKKADAAPAAESASKGQTPAAGSGGNKRVSGMSQVLHESVPETALDKFKENDAFIHYDGGKPKYIGIVLNTADIGGLDKKSRRDEAKGSIIECINSGRIQTYITPDLMDAEMICIIPDAVTLTAMDEFSLLTDAPYEFCQVDESGDVELLGIKTTFSQVSDLVVDDGHIDDLLGNGDDEPAEEEDDSDFFDEEAAPAATSGEAVPAEQDDNIEDMDDIPDVDAESDVPAYDAGQDMGVEPDVDTEAETLVTGEDGEAYDPYAEAMKADAMPEQTVPGEISDQVMVRKFYSDELGLEVTSEPFDAQFMQGNPYIPFPEDRPAGWVNEQLNEMSREANLELARMHQDNLWQMRERYFKLASLACDRIRADLDIHDADTQYGQMYNNIVASKQDAMEGLDQRVTRRKTEIENNWRQELQAVGMKGARDAQQKHRERYGRQHELEIYNIEATERASIEDDYHDALHELGQRRRSEAGSLFDLSITEILDELDDMYLTCLADERARREELSAEMRRFVDSSRLDDIARTKTLDEELRQTDKADKVLAEQTAKMQSMSEEYRRNRESLLEEIENIKRANAQKLAEMKESHEQSVSDWSEERKAMEQRYRDLLTRFESLDQDKDKEYEARLSAMRDTNDMLEDRCDHLIEVHRRSNLISVFLLIAGVIAALAIGFIGGEYINTQRHTALEQQKILDDFQQSDDAASDPAEDPAQE